MMTSCPYAVLDAEQARAAYDVDDERPEIPFMPIGEAADMGHAADGTPLVDPRLFDSAEWQRNPYPYLRILRDHHPVFHDKLHNCYWVTRYEDIEAVYFDEAGFNTIPKGSSSGVLGNTQLELSGVEHRRRRNIYGRHLVGAPLTKRLPALQRIAEDMIESWFVDGGPAELDPATGRYTIEFGRAFANEFPIRVVCQVLGFPDDTRDRFFYWYHSMMSGLGGAPGHAEGLEARRELEEFVGGLVEARRAEPSYLYDADGNQVAMDIISELCHSVIDGDVMSTEEITSFIALIVGGGGETTRGSILNMWYLLLQHPDQLAEVLADEQLWPQTFQEALRHATPVGGLQPRHNTSDAVMHDVFVPAGSLLKMVDYSANHDERVYADPERFDIHRQDLYTGKILRSGTHKDGVHSHLGFGVGTHLCPGAWISTQESVLGSQIVGRHIKNPTLAVDRMPKDVDGVTPIPIGVGAIDELWIEFERA
jgi:cytochrome P450